MSSSGTGGLVLHPMKYCREVAQVTFVVPSKHRGCDFRTASVPSLYTGSIRGNKRDLRD